MMRLPAAAGVAISESGCGNCSLRKSRKARERGRPGGTGGGQAQQEDHGLQSLAIFQRVVAQVFLLRFAEGGDHLLYCLGDGVLLRQRRRRLIPRARS